LRNSRVFVAVAGFGSHSLVSISIEVNVPDFAFEILAEAKIRRVFEERESAGLRRLVFPFGEVLDRGPGIAYRVPGES
jgi:hypothetical protein